ncbi:unnamed protein product [Acanthoscelides obtectus]|nr:unnamed protein product [Acanthoscelides obtectus]CAK1651909.1 Tyrosine-protein kinase PR2 [Acanthoscelides obtectus]
MVTNPLRILRSGLPVINSRTRSASVASTLPPKVKNSVRNSVPENLHNRQEFLHATLPRPTSISQQSSTTPSDHKDENPIPLPPRDKSKALLTAKPRHTRKYPLIIPHSSLQRTLDKVNMASSPPNSSEEVFEKTEPVYTNHLAQVAEKDHESQHFEEQIESNLNALDEILVEQDVVDGEAFSNFKNEDEKIHSHHVSCEDLLKFANSKPPSRTRGNDSDEVRIMSKVLGKDVSTEKCLQALDQSDWDMMKAIKILKLQNVVSADLQACFNALENSMWDITKAAQWMLQQDGDVTQV